jgi:hypothetical protein
VIALSAAQNVPLFVVKQEPFLPTTIAVRLSQQENRRNTNFDRSNDLTTSTYPVLFLDGNSRTWSPRFLRVFLFVDFLVRFFADHFLLGSKLTQKNTHTHTNRGSHMTLTRPYLAKDCVVVGFFPPSHSFPPIWFFVFAVQQDPFLPAAVFCGFLLVSFNDVC